MGETWSKPKPPEGPHSLVLDTDLSCIRKNVVESILPKYPFRKKSFCDKISWAEWKKLDAELVKTWNGAQKSIARRSLRFLPGLLMGLVGTALFLSQKAFALALFLTVFSPIVFLALPLWFSKSNFVSRRRAVYDIIAKANKYVFVPRGMLMKYMKFTEKYTDGGEQVKHKITEWFEIALTPDEADLLIKKRSVTIVDHRESLFSEITLTSYRNHRCLFRGEDIEFEKLFKPEIPEDSQSIHRSVSNVSFLDMSTEVVWCWEGTKDEAEKYSKWIKYDEHWATVLEQTYQLDPRGWCATLPDPTYIVDFQTMIQTHSPSQSQARVCRIDISRSPTVWCWKESPKKMHKHKKSFVAGDPADCWVKFNKENNALIKTAYALGLEECSVRHGRYTVNFDSLKLKRNSDEKKHGRDVKLVDLFSDATSSSHEARISSLGLETV